MWVGVCVCVCVCVYAFVCVCVYVCVCVCVHACMSIYSQCFNSYIRTIYSHNHNMQVSVSVYSGFESEKDWVPRDSVSPVNHTSSEGQKDREDEAEAAEPTESSHIEKSPNSIPESHSDSNVQPDNMGGSVSGGLKDNLPLQEDSPVDVQGGMEVIHPPDIDPKVTVASERTSERDENGKGVVSNGDSEESDHPVDVNVTVLSREEFVNKDSSTNFPQITVVRDQRKKSSSSDSEKKLQTQSQSNTTTSIHESGESNPSLSIEAIDPPVIKFGNLLDSCKAGESDDPKAKVRVIKPSGQEPESGSGFSQWDMQGKDRQDSTGL